MASVRGPDPCLAAGSDPDCVTTNRVRDTTYVGTGPGWLPWPKKQQRERMANTGIEKRKANTKRRTHLNQRKSGLLLLFYFYFLLFSLHLSFMTSKALKLKKKTKTKKNQSPDPAILGRIRTRDPDPDHFGPDFDSGSGCGSAFTDQQSGSPQKHGLV